MADFQHTKRARKVQDLTGQRFNHLTVKEFVGTTPEEGAHWLCVCDCGGEKTTSSHRLRRNAVKSCGCKRDQKKDPSELKKYVPPIEKMSYDGMKSRCYRPADIAYDRYGGRGITVCDRWRFGESGKSGYQCFFEDMGPRPSSYHTLDRKAVNGHYEPLNCKWSTKREQAENRRNNALVTINGVTKCISEWARDAGFGWHVIASRLKMGWPEERLLDPLQNQATMVEFEGKTQSLSEWACEKGFDRSTLSDRWNRGLRPPHLFETKHQIAARRTAFLTVNGETYSLDEWEQRTGIRKETLRMRVARGFSPEKILLPPIRK